MRARIEAPDGSLCRADAVGNSGSANLLFLLFAGAIVLTLCSIIAFVAEMLLAARGVRQAVDHSVARSNNRASTL